jgi:hypothetical protein
LRYQFKAGSSVVYELKQSFSNPGTGESIEFTDEVTYKVDSVSSIGIAQLVVSKKAVKMAIDGQDIPVPAGPPTVLKEQRNQRGDVHKREPEPAEPRAYGRITRMLDLPYPVEALVLKKEVELKRPGEDDLKFAPVSWKLKLLSFNRDAANFDVTFLETEGQPAISASGKAVVDLRTGWPKQISLKATNVELPGDEARSLVNLTLEFKRKEPTPK